MFAAWNRRDTHSSCGQQISCRFLEAAGKSFTAEAKTTSTHNMVVFAAREWTIHVPLSRWVATKRHHKHRDQDGQTMFLIPSRHQHGKAAARPRKTKQLDVPA